MVRTEKDLLNGIAALPRKKNLLKLKEEFAVIE